MTKICVKCGQPGEFYKHRRKCKSCISQERKEKLRPDNFSDIKRQYRFNSSVKDVQETFSSPEQITTGNIIKYLARHHKRGKKQKDILAVVIDNARCVLGN